MKHLFIIISLLFSVNICAQNINWMGLEEALEMQNKNPKNIIIDVYTNWCGPCKLLDKNTFQNKKVADFINQNYYAVKFNAEGNEVINFDDREFLNPNYKPALANRRNGNHQLTRYLGVSAYPTIVFLDTESNIIYKLRGYNTPAQIEIWLKLFKDEEHKNIKSQDDFNNFQKSFVPEF
ncbi:MAG: thioredoxin-related protein [Flavobacteriaceae bacterium]|jgi:thioredoxin-related protein|tara:strand:- start:659 stop:1195 length:537 start_codon:yes stop_codon:yes gene_type:complete